MELYSEVYQAPDTDDGPFDSYEDADRHKDYLESFYNIGGFKIVKFLDEFYVV